MDDRVNTIDHTLVMGGGLAGLSAAHALTASHYPVTVIEADECVGGLARTVEHNGFRFDLGGHRFVTQDQALENFVRNLLNEDCLIVPRSSKILLRNRYFDYPLKPFNAFFGFGPKVSAQILTDYLLERLRAQFISDTPVSLEDWVVTNFGRTMFNVYFRDYSEKVWGIDCQRIDQKWVEQRIQGLSLGKAIAKALLPSRGGDLATLANRFLYPRLGIGQITDNMAVDIRKENTIHTQTRVQFVNHSRSRVDSVKVLSDNRPSLLSANQFISTLPLPILVQSLRPLSPDYVLEAASRLRSRDLVTVTLMINRPRVTDQTWIYVPEKSIPFGRIHEPTNWSRSMAPDGQSLLVIEYFCFCGDKIWNSDDEDLVALTSKHLINLGIINQDDIIDQVVLRIPNAYPLFEVGYSDHCRTIYNYLETFENLYTAGRGGMFRYYNMDRAMQAGFDAAHSILQRQTKPMESVSAPYKSGVPSGNSSRGILGEAE